MLKHLVRLLIISFILSLNGPSASFATELILNIGSGYKLPIFGTTSHKEIGKVRGRTRVRVLKQSPNFYLVETTTIDGKKVSGWMHKGKKQSFFKHASTSSSSSSSRSNLVRLKGNYNVRTGTHTGTRSLGVVNKVEVIECGYRNNRCKVRTSVGVGFVPKRAITGQRVSGSSSTEGEYCIDCGSGNSQSRITVGSGAFSNYHKNPKVARTIAQCKKRYGRPKGTGYCLRGVRISGQKGGLIGANLGSWASRSGKHLKRQGFINLLEDPVYKRKITSPGDRDIPIGAILVYSGTNRSKRGRNGKKIHYSVPLGQGYGHAEIKTGSSSYCSDYSTSVPGGMAKIRGNKMEGGTGYRRRRLIGVWVKPGL